LTAECVEAGEAICKRWPSPLLIRYSGSKSVMIRFHAPKKFGTLPIRVFSSLTMSFSSLMILRSFCNWAAFPPKALRVQCLLFLFDLAGGFVGLL
jgi:hypothetical protein